MIGRNRPHGKGGNVTAAATAALEGLDPATTVVLLCDGDLGEPAGRLLPLIEAVEAGECDLAVAAFERRVGGGFGLAKGYARNAIRKLCGLETTAPISGPAGDARRPARAVLPVRPRYGMEIGMTVDAVRAGYRVEEVELDLAHRATGRTLAGFAPPRPPASRLRRASTATAPATSIGSPPVILAIDQGTTGSTCLVFDGDGRDRRPRLPEFAQYFPRPGWVEHDANEIWEVTRQVGREALADARHRRHRPERDRDHQPARDRRRLGSGHRRADPPRARLAGPAHRGALRRAARAGHTDLVRERTGLVIDPYFSGTKIEWLLRNVDGAERARFGTIDSWLVHKLCGVHVTDLSNASRTMLLDIRSGRWDAELCGLLGVDPGSLPEPRGSAEVYGVTGEFGGEVPVAGIAGDQQAALFGQACHAPGDAKNTYGTGSFVLLNSGPEPPEPFEGLLGTVAWGLGGETTYALEAAVFVTGSAVQWLRDGLGLIETAAETETLAASLYGNDDVYFVPALTGLGSPYWDPYARGALVGLTRGTGRAQIARATLEAIAYQTVDAVRAQEAASGERLSSLRADGGAVGNGWLMQFQADVLGAPVVVPEIAETTGARRRLSRRHRRRALGPRSGGGDVAPSGSPTSRGCPPTSGNRCSRAGTRRSRARATGPGPGPGSP